MVFYLSRVFQIMEGLPWDKIIVITFTANIFLWFASGAVELLKPYFYDANEEDDSKQNEFYESEE